VRCESGTRSWTFVRFRSALRPPRRNAGIKPVEGALVPTGHTPNSRGIGGRLVQSPSRTASAARGMPGMRWKLDPGRFVRQEGVRPRSELGVGSPSRKVRGVGDTGATRRRAVRLRAKPSWLKTTLFSKWIQGREPPTTSGKLTDRGSAMWRRKHHVGRTSAERRPPP
jgi:hypothetical protein